MSYLAKNYNRKKLHLNTEEAVICFQLDGKKYLDFVQGIAVNSLGHAHPKLVKLLKNNQKNFGMYLMLFQIPEGEN